MAEALKRALDVEVETRPGERAQFSVYVGEREVFSRSRALWRRYLGGGWPDAAKLAARIASLLSEDARA